jgi:hypothetical protein
MLEILSPIEVWLDKSSGDIWNIYQIDKDASLKHANCYIVTKENSGKIEIRLTRSGLDDVHSAFLTLGFDNRTSYKK